MVPTLTKLKGRDNYKIWIYEIQSNAQIYGVWDAIINPDTMLPPEQQAFALSLLFRNTIPSIQTALTAYSTAPKAWQYLSEQYNKQNIAQLVKEVQDLTFLDYNFFSTIESFQQKAQIILQRLLDYSGSPENAFYALFASHLLLAIGKANSAARASIEDSINLQQRSNPKDILDYIFQRLFSFRLPKGRKDPVKAPQVNSSNTSASLPCSACNRPHGPICFVLDPSKAPRRTQSHFKSLHQAYKAGKAKKDNKKETEDAEKTESGQLGLVQSVQSNQSQPAIWFDSGADDSICPDRSLFVELEPCYRRFNTASGSPLIAKGKGVILLYSPSAQSIRNVYYCPEAKSTLISAQWFLKHRMQFAYEANNKAHIEIDGGRRVLALDLSGRIPRIIHSPPINAVTRRQNGAKAGAGAGAESGHQQTGSGPGSGPQEMETGPNGQRSQGNSLNEPQSNDLRHQKNAENSKISDLQQPSQSVEKSSNHAPVTKTKIPRSTLDQWHQRLAHLSRTQIRKLHAAKLIHITKSIGDPSSCDTCLESKTTRKPSASPSQLPKATRPFERLHFDLIGGQKSFPITTGLYKYILLVTDDYSGYSWAWAIKSKSQSVSKLLWLFKALKTRYPISGSGSTPFNPGVVYLHTDDAAEWESKEFRDFVTKWGLTVEISAPYAHEQNGKAERHNRILLNLLRSLLIQSRLPNTFWPVILPLALLHKNMAPKPQFGQKGHKATPYQELFDRPSPLYAQVRPCGALVWVTQGIKPQNKLAAKAVPMAYLGHEGTKKYILWDGSSIRKSRDVYFTDQCWMDYIEDLRPSAPLQQDQEDAQHQLDSALQEQNQNQNPSLPKQDLVRVVIPYLPPSINAIQADLAQSLAAAKPNSYQEAMASPQSNQWLLSMKEEFDALQQQGTWTEIPRNNVSKGERILTGKWVYDIKPNGRYKSRWVIRGFQQQLDPWETTRAAVVKGTTLRIFLHIAVSFNWDIYFVDIKNAFLNGTHSGRPIYLRLPNGFKKKDTVCQLNKSLYGLKTAAITWYLDLVEKLVSVGFRTSQHDECLFIRESTFVLVHVDDLAVFNDPSHTVKEELNAFFNLSVPSQDRYLGLEVQKQADGAIKLSQEAYTAEILLEFRDLIRQSNTPISKRAQGNDAKAPATEVTHFQRLIGKLMFLACQTRPDLMYAVIHVSSYASNPSSSAWEVARDILGYLSQTSKHSLRIQKGAPLLPLGQPISGQPISGQPNFGQYELQITQFCDASFATGSKGRSITGAITLLGGTPLLWFSRQQTSVATSTAHSEFIAAYDATLAVLPLYPLLSEILPDHAIPKPRLITDNLATLTTANSGLLTRQNRHFLVKYYWLHEQLDNNELTAGWIPTDQQLADLLTKPPTPQMIEFFCSSIGLG
jgi:hypothetical protein